MAVAKVLWISYWPGSAVIDGHAQWMSRQPAAFADSQDL